MASQTSITGAAGEHYVMSQLLRHGMIAALAPVGVPNCDIVVTDDLGDRLCAVQVKTRQNKGTDGGWHMSRKHETIVADSLFYAFVSFDTEIDGPTACYVVPSRVVAAAVAESHAKWLSEPGRNGHVRKDSNLRRFMPDYERVHLDIGRGPGWLEPYREAWSLLTAAANDETSAAG